MSRTLVRQSLRRSPRLDPFYGAVRTRVVPLLDVLAPRPCLACTRLVEPESRGVVGLCRRCHGGLRPARTRPRCALCGESRSRIGRTGVCTACAEASPRPAWTSLTFAWVYAPPLDAVVTALKFRRLEALGERLGRAAVDELARPAPFENATSLASTVTWVPLHWRRRLTRGFDQAEEIARGVAARLDLPCEPLLRRRRATAPQSLAGRTARLENLRDAFRPRTRAAPARVLLVDDVITTGATLSTAARALRSAGVRRVDVFAVARAPGASSPELP